VSVSGGGTGAVASAADRELAEEMFEEEGEKKGGKGVPLHNALINVDRRGGAIGVLKLVVKTPWSCSHVSTNVGGIPS
jgi:hypothetical protein